MAETRRRKTSKTSKASKTLKSLSKPAASRGGRPDADRIILKALKEAPAPQGGDAAGQKVLYWYDETFSVGIVYAYGPLSLYRDLVARLYPEEMRDEDHEKTWKETAKGYCTFGPCRNPDSAPGEDLPPVASVGLIWLNNCSPLLETLPVCVHEITHLTQDVLHLARVEDSSGEVQAYMAEREFAKVMEQLYGMKVPRNVKKILEELLCSNCKDCKVDSTEKTEAKETGRQDP